MNLKITEEGKMNAIRAAVRPGENVRAAAYGQLITVKAALVYYMFGALGALISGAKTKNGFTILTDNAVKIVCMNAFDMTKVDDVFEIPFNEFKKVKYKKPKFGSHIITFKVNKVSYKLTLFKNAGKHIQNQKENVEVFSQFFDNLKNMQKAS